MNAKRSNELALWRGPYSNPNTKELLGYVHLWAKDRKELVNIVRVELGIPVTLNEVIIWWCRMKQDYYLNQATDYDTIYLERNHGKDLVELKRFETYSNN